MYLVPKSLTGIRIPIVYLQGAVLKLVDRKKYLGVFFTSDMKDNIDLQRELRSIYRRGKILLRIQYM